MTFKNGDRVVVRSKHIESLVFEGVYCSETVSIIDIEPEGHRFMVPITGVGSDWDIELAKPRITFGPGASVSGGANGNVETFVRMDDGNWVFCGSGTRSTLWDDEVARLLEYKEGWRYEVLSYGVGGGVK